MSILAVMEKHLTWIPKPERCCCMCNVRGGSIIIGWLGEIGNVLKLVLCAVILTQMQAKREDVPSIFHPFHVDREAGTAFLVGVLIDSLLSIVVSGLLLYGAYNDKPRFVLVYVLTGIVFFVMAIVTLILYGVYLCMEHQLSRMYLLIISVLFLGILIYFWIVVFSYYRRLMDGTASSVPFVNF
ncbi:lysosomal-associated transmembrane protein 4A-like isoform X2 [Periplaneta americana]|uniref:lysosomal-associated transmembrane protein 4A-like isoform X2 n=1 Tax=Periplaneta americana TaxID=6978 RepID=UPI0037E9419D